ncbi:Os01g0107750, partial [Oryza sativa Japonica Group]
MGFTSKEVKNQKLYYTFKSGGSVSSIEPSSKFSAGEGEGTKNMEGTVKSLGQKRRGDLELEDGSGRKRRLGGGRGVGLVACVVVEEGGEEIRVGGVLGGRGGQQKERRRGRECGDGSAGGERAAASEEVARERRRHFGGRRPAAAPEPG